MPAATEPLNETSKALATDAPLLACPECGEEVWDLPLGHKLAKCWNAGGHASGGTLAFDTLTEEDEEDD